MLLVNLLESQTRHHGTDVVRVQVLAQGRVDTNLLQNLRGVAELDVLQWRVGQWHLVILQYLLLGIVGYHEEAVVAAHQLDVVPRQPECPLQRLALRMAHHLLTQCHCLGKHVVVVYRTLDALYQLRTVAAVLLVGDELLVVGGAAERSAVGHLRTVLVVRSADGECHLGHVALEGAQVLAEYHLKLVETEQSLAAESLHEVLVCVGSRRVVEEVLAQLWGQQHLEERGLEDAALAHEYGIIWFTTFSVTHATTIAISHFLKK